MRLRIFVFFILFIVQAAWADVELLYFKASNSPEIFMIPLRTGETPSMALRNYQEALLKSKNMERYFNNFSELKIESFSRELSQEYLTLVVANDPEDIGSSNRRLKTVTEPLRKADVHGNRVTAVLPLGSSLRLTPSEREEYHRKIAERASLLVLMGGADIHPAFYDESITHAKPANVMIDALEIRLVRDYYKYGKGTLFGICRGSQMVNVAMGNRLNQDVQEDHATTLSHRDGVLHDLLQKETSDLFFGQLFNGERIIVNSYHHQSAKVREGSIVEVAAVSPDGIAEAFTSRDHRMVLVQWHPELRPTLESIGQRLINKIVFRASGKNYCSKVHLEN